jgi:hypothetical protein
MSSWRDKILKEFSPGVARLTLVADPDALLVDEGVLQGSGCAFSRIGSYAAK